MKAWPCDEMVQSNLADIGAGFSEDGGESFHCLTVASRDADTTRSGRGNETPRTFGGHVLVARERVNFTSLGLH